MMFLIINLLLILFRIQKIIQTWKDIKEGANINTEIDIFARYISRQIEEK